MSRDVLVLNIMIYVICNSNLLEEEWCIYVYADLEIVIEPHTRANFNIHSLSLTFEYVCILFIVLKGKCKWKLSCYLLL